MQYEDFLERVRARARLASMADAIRVTRATLSTLGERLLDDPQYVAAQLPRELGQWLEGRNREREPFGFDEFIRRVGLRSDLDRLEATFRAHVVFEVLREAVRPGVFLRFRQFCRNLRRMVLGPEIRVPESTVL